MARMLPELPPPSPGTSDEWEITRIKGFCVLAPDYHGIQLAFFEDSLNRTQPINCSDPKDVKIAIIDHACEDDSLDSVCLFKAQKPGASGVAEHYRINFAPSDDCSARVVHALEYMRDNKVLIGVFPELTMTEALTDLIRETLRGFWIRLGACHLTKRATLH
jgi:hypothetical protein